jgi:nucleoside-diphosphate-sugar epimerase
MKIFVTGATGYIGQKIVTRLVNQGHEVHILCRKTPYQHVFNNSRVKIFTGDLLDQDTVLEAAKDCEQVYHVAAYAKVWAKDSRTFFDINVQGTVNVLSTALKSGVKKLVFTSTGGTYGVSNGTPLDETIVRKTSFFTDYECSKFMAEEKVLQYVNKGLDAVIVNPVRVYGPGTWTESNAVSLLIKAYVTGEWHVIPGNGKTIGCFSFIDDVVDGHLLAMKNGRPGERYILGGENADFNTFFARLRDITKQRYLLVKVPLPLMMAFAWTEEVKANALGIEPMITRKWLKKYSYDIACSSEKAIHELGYKITPLEIGIGKTLDWLKNDCKVEY